MAINIALKRARKAKRRKERLADLRKIETIETSLAARVLRASSLPLRECLFQDAVFEGGIGTLIVVRGATSRHLTIGMFLIDVLCLGVKDVNFVAVDSETFEAHRAALEHSSPLVSIEPARARKLLRDVVRWASSFGFAPHKDFAAVEPFFGDSYESDCAEAFQFGRDGHPLYIPGPSESRALVAKRLAHIRERFGDEATGSGEEAASP